MTTIGNRMHIVTLSPAAPALTVAAGAAWELSGKTSLAKGKLALDGAVAAGAVVEFTRVGETLSLGAAKSFGGEVKNFKLGDTIDLTGVTLGKAGGVVALEWPTVSWSQGVTF